MDFDDIVKIVDQVKLLEARLAKAEEERSASNAQLASVLHDIRLVVAERDAARAGEARLNKQLEATPGMKVFIWMDHHSYVALAHARSVAEARSMLDQEVGGHDGSCPVRNKARKAVAEKGPEIWRGRVALFAGSEEPDADLQEKYDAARAGVEKLVAQNDLFLKSIGECHVMISRQTSDYQLAKKDWDATTLPARVSRLMEALLTAQAGEARAVEALDVFARAYRVSMLPFAPGIDEADGANHWMPHGWPSVADFKQANAALADSSALDWLAQQRREAAAEALEKLEAECGFVFDGDLPHVTIVTILEHLAALRAGEVGK